jgi:hypothetical protein
MIRLGIPYTKPAPVFFPKGQYWDETNNRDEVGIVPGNIGALLPKILGIRQRTEAVVQYRRCLSLLGMGRALRALKHPLRVHCWTSPGVPETLPHYIVGISWARFIVVVAGKNSKLHGWRKTAAEIADGLPWQSQDMRRCANAAARATWTLSPNPKKGLKVPHGTTTIWVVNMLLIRKGLGSTW